MFKRHLMFTLLILLVLGLSGCGSSGGSSSSSSGGGGVTPTPTPTPSTSSSGISGTITADLLKSATVILQDSNGEQVATTTTGTDGTYNFPGSVVDPLTDDQYPLVVTATGGTFASSGSANTLNLKSVCSDVPVVGSSTPSTCNIWLGSTVLVQTMQNMGVTQPLDAMERAKSVLKTMLPSLADTINGFGDLNTLDVTPAATGTGLDTETLSTTLLATYGATHDSLGDTLSDSIIDVVTSYNTAVSSGADPTAAVTSKIAETNPSVGTNLLTYQKSDTFKANVATQVASITGADSATIESKITTPTGYNTDAASMTVTKGSSSAVNPNQSTTDLVTSSGTMTIEYTPTLYTLNGTVPTDNKIKVDWGSSAFVSAVTVGGGAYTENDAVNAAQVVKFTVLRNETGSFTVTTTANNASTVKQSFTVTFVSPTTSAAVSAVTLDVGDGNPGSGADVNGATFLMINDQGATGQSSAIADGKITVDAKSGAYSDYSVASVDPLKVATTGSGSNSIDFIVSLIAPTGVQFEYSADKFSANWDKVWNVGDGQLTFSPRSIKITESMAPGKKTFDVKVYKGSKTSDNLQTSASNGSMYVLSSGLADKVAAIQDVRFSGMSNRTSVVDTFAFDDVKNSTLATTDLFFNGTVKTWGNMAGMSVVPSSTPASMQLITVGRSGSNTLAGFACNDLATTYNAEFTFTPVVGPVGDYAYFNSTIPVKGDEGSYFHIRTGNGLSNEETIKVVLPQSTAAGSLQGKVTSTTGVTFSDTDPNQ